MYKAGQFVVMCKTIHGTYYRSLVFETEQDARNWGNAQWVKPYVVKVEISKSGFYKKRRKSMVIAEATKEVK